MRRTGRTTRKVDQAVQLLFDEGEITVLRDSDIRDKKEEWKRGLSAHQITIRRMLIDGAVVISGNAQQELIHRIIKRLESEHPEQWTRNGNTFKLKR